MLGLLLFISALSVLIICARMHDCHVLILSVCESVILIRIIGKKTHWKLDKPIIRKLVLLYASRTLEGRLSCHWWLIASVDVRLSDVTWQGNIIKPQIELWLWAVSTSVWRHRTEMPPKERKNRVNRYKIKCLKCTPNVVIYSRIKRRANYLSRILKS